MRWALLRREKDHAGVSLGSSAFRNETVVPNRRGSEGGLEPGQIFTSKRSPVGDGLEKKVELSGGNYKGARYLDSTSQGPKSLARDEVVCETHVTKIRNSD